MPWQVSTDRATWTDLDAAGISGCLLRFVALGVDTATLTVDGDYLASPLAVYGATLYLRDAGGTQRFIGRVEGLPRQAMGPAESYQVELVGGWWWLERVSAQQRWAYAEGVARDYARMILGEDETGALVTLGASLTEAIDRAVSRGAPIVRGTIAALGTVPPFEVSNQRCSDVILAALRYFPDHVVAWDYSGATPSLSIRAASSLSAVNVDLAAYPPTDIQIAPRYADQAVGVRVVYEVVSQQIDDETGASTPVHSHIVDVAGSANDPLAVEVVFPLRGRTVRRALVESLEQAVETETISTSSKTFWAGIFYGVLGAVPEADWTLDAVNTPAGALYPRRLTGGAYVSWMGTDFGVAAHEEAWSIDVTISRRDLADNVVSLSKRRLACRWVSTTASTRTYTRTRYEEVEEDPAESIPEGVALALFNAWTRLHWDGRISWVSDTDLAWYTLGAVLRLSNGRAEWAAMDAVIRQAEYDVASGRTTLLPGAAVRLEPEAALALSRASRAFRKPDAGRADADSPDAWRSYGPLFNAADHTIAEGDLGVPQKLRLADAATGLKVIHLDTSLITGKIESEVNIGSTLQPRIVWEVEPTFDEDDNLTSLAFRQREVIASAALADDVDVDVDECETA